MKKIFAGIALPTLAAVAVIGSGFSVWFFGENQDKVSTNASIKVENLLKIGSLTADSSEGLLHLDQTADVREGILRSSLVNAAANKNFDKASNYLASAAGSDAEAKGLYLTKKNLTDTFTGKISYTKYAGDGYVEEIDTYCKVEIKTTFTFGSKLKNYVAMDTTTGDWTGSDAAAGKYVYTWADQADKTLHIKDATDATFNFVYVANSTIYDHLGEGKVDPNRATTSDAKMKTAEPHTDAEYDKMRADVTGEQLTIETVATIVKVGA